MTTPAGLTAREVAALGFLHRYISGVGYPPSVRDLVEEFGWSLSGTQYVLQGLAAKGAIRRDPKVPRGLVILTPDEVTAS
jgi:SOS-response transcriptional repressor LexA